LIALLLLVCSAPSPGRGGTYDLQEGCDVMLVNTQIADNGDGDGFADTNETLQIALTVEARHCETPPSHCVARLSTESPAVDCMPRAEAFIGTLPATQTPFEVAQPFVIKISDLDRQGLGLGPDDWLEAKLFVEIDCVDSVARLAQEISFPLDLNVSDQGQTPTPWFESFESGTLGAFEAQNNDDGIPGGSFVEGLINGDGWRCQYTDPDWPNSASYNQDTSEVCFPGSNLAQSEAVFWQVDGDTVAESPDGGRARSGAHSMYYGVFLTDPNDDFTTPLSIVEASGMTDPVHLGVGSPQLSFWHQISLADHRMIQAPDRRSADRGVVQIQLAGASGESTTPWMNLQAIQNGYDEQNADNFFNCEFDPIDDGNTEDDFFDPTDPNREHGPSSTCYPEYTWAWMGSTVNDPEDGIHGHATDLPGTFGPGSLGDGTWVETQVDLTKFRGRSARFRFLVTSIKTYAWNYFDQFGDNNEWDDGWWIDDVLVDETLDQPAEFTNDSFVLGSCSGTGVPCIGQCRTSLAPCSATVPCGAGEGDCVMPCAIGEVCAAPAPDCGTDCTEVQANLFVEPVGMQNPGTVSVTYGDEVHLNAAASVDLATGAEPSWADACIDGYLEYRLCVTGNPDGGGGADPDADCDDAVDRDLVTPAWSSTFLATVVPEIKTTYAVEVRCSNVPACRDSEIVEVVVECANGNPNTSGLKSLHAQDHETLAWVGALDVDWLRGSFVSAADIGSYTEDFTAFAADATSIPMDGNPPIGAGYYYLVKRDGFPGPFNPQYVCDSVTWRSGGGAERHEPARNFSFGDP
jgi:hypothetical protein